jgi:hypothetical protein
MSLLFSLVRVFVYHTKISPRRLSGESPQLGDGVSKLALGGPPGGSPGPTRHRAPIMAKTRPNESLGGSWGAPGGAPGGSLWGPGGLWGGPGAPPGGVPPGGPPGGRPPYGQYCPSGAAPLGGPPGGPPGGPCWGVRARWGPNPAKARLTGGDRGGRGAPPKAHWVRSLQGGPKRAQF